MIIKNNLRLWFFEPGTFLSSGCVFLVLDKKTNKYDQLRLNLLDFNGKFCEVTLFAQNFNKFFTTVLDIDNVL
jgi:hypothetical protein